MLETPGDSRSHEREGRGSAAHRKDYSLAIGLMALLVIESVVVASIMVGVGVSPAIVIAVWAGMLVLPLLIFVLIVRLLWSPVARTFPEQSIEPDAVVRTWQTFSLGGLSRFNHCVKLAVDTKCLHAELMPPLHWFGAKRISIPWEAFSTPRASRWSKEWKSAEAGGRAISGPAWCFTLAEAESHSSRDAKSQLTS